jgi:hypothetical protein
MTMIEQLSFADLARHETGGHEFAQRESSATRQLTLPGGYVAADGSVHRRLLVRELTGADEEALFDREYKSDAQRVSAFLARTIEAVEGRRQPVDSAFVEALSIGDRDYLLLRMRQLDLGDTVHQVARCPSCAQKVDVDFAISELPLRHAPQPQPAYAVEAGGRKLQVRLPNGADQAALEALPSANPAVANSVLFARVVLDVNGEGPPSEEDVRGWPIAMRAELIAWLETNAPGPDLFIDIACPYCRADMSYSFDLDAFFLPSGRRA